MIIAPLAVIPLAMVAAAVSYVGVLLGLPVLVTALLILATMALGSRAIHLDGLADTVDGLGVSWDRERSWAVMRSGDVGPMGVVALLLVLGLQAVALGEIVTRPAGPLQVAVLICASRGALALACVRGLPAARPDGLGAAVADSVPRWAVAAVWLLITLALFALALPAWRLWWVPLTQVVLALIAAMIILVHCRRRLGGVTGDVLGATVELTFTALLLATVIG